MKYTPSIEVTKQKSRVAFVLPHSTHYTQGLFEILAMRFDADFFFFSDGKDWYWEHRNGSGGGRFRHKYLPGFRMGNARIVPSLPFCLLGGKYDAIVAGIDGRYALPIAIACSRLKRIPFVLWTGIWNRIQTPFHRLIFPVTRYVYRSSDSVIAYGEHVKQYLHSEQVKSERIFVAPHAVDNARCSRAIPKQEITVLRDRLQVKKSTALLLFVGRLEPVKGIPYLLEAVEQLRDRDVALVIVGEGGEGSKLRAKARELGLTSMVKFTGHVSPAQTAGFYAAAHALVVPSVTTAREKETWGLVVNEAMNQGLPVIASDTVGAAAGGLVRDGVNGFVVPERDSSAIAHAIRKLLDDAVLQERLGVAARSSVADWNHERMADGFEQCINHALARRASSADRCETSIRFRANEPS